MKREMLPSEHRTLNIEHRTSNIEHRTSNIHSRASNTLSTRSSSGCKGSNSRGSGVSVSKRVASVRAKKRWTTSLVRTLGSGFGTRSADFQSAVSQVCNLPGSRPLKGAWEYRALCRLEIGDTAD